jgi:hypothetical protein
MVVGVIVSGVALAGKDTARERRATPTVVLQGDDYVLPGVGNWSSEGKTARADERPAIIDYPLPHLESGIYEITVTVQNGGDLPACYSDFTLLLGADGTSTFIDIPARSNGWSSESGILDLNAGQFDLRIIWMGSDSAAEGSSCDTVLQIKKVKVKRVGDSER